MGKVLLLYLHIFVAVTSLHDNYGSIIERATAHMNEEYRLARKWWILDVIALVLFAADAFCIWVIAWPAIVAQEAGQPSPADWNWVSILLAGTLIVSLHAILIGVGLTQLLISFNKHGVRKPSLFGATFIRWTDVTLVTGYAPDRIVLELRSSKKKIRINMLYFKDKNALISLVRSHVPSSAKSDRPHS